MPPSKSLSLNGARVSSDFRDRFHGARICPRSPRLQERHDSYETGSFSPLSKMSRKEVKMDQMVVKSVVSAGSSKNKVKTCRVWYRSS